MPGVRHVYNLHANPAMHISFMFLFAAVENTPRLKEFLQWDRHKNFARIGDTANFTSSPGWMPESSSQSHRK